MRFKRFKKFAALAAIGGAIIFGGNITADAANLNQDGIWAFREAYISQVPDTRAFKQDLTLISPNFHLDIDSKAQVLKDGSMRMGGQFNWTYTNLKNNFSINTTIPFYIEQIGNEMTLYVNRKGKWSKMLLPGLPSGLALLWKSQDPLIQNQVMDAVKKIEILNDTPNLRTLNVTLDGIKLANILNENSATTFANLEGEELAEQKKIFYRWLSAFRKTDIIFNWTVNKPSWTTATAVFDLTSIMRAYAIYVLNESAAGRVELTDEERDLLDAIGYYSELHSYTTHLKPSGNNLVNLPAELSAAPENDDSLNDIFAEMTSVVEK